MVSKRFLTKAAALLLLALVCADWPQQVQAVRNNDDESSSRNVSHTNHVTKQDAKKQQQQQLRHLKKGDKKENDDTEPKGKEALGDEKDDEKKQSKALSADEDSDDNEKKEDSENDEKKKKDKVAASISTKESIAEEKPISAKEEETNQAEETANEPAEETTKVPQPQFQESKAKAYVLPSKDQAGFRQLGTLLTKLINLYNDPEDGSAAIKQITSSGLLRIVDNTKVLVEIIGIDESIESVLASSGLPIEVTGCFSRSCSAYVPIDKLEQLAQLPQVMFVRPTAAAKNVGLVTSEGGPAMKSDQASLAFGVNGTGLLIGVLSDSYDCVLDAATDIATGDLPPDVIVIRDYFGFDCTDEGRAMLQLIHDVAPGAKLAFRTAFEGNADFAKGIIDLANAGCDVIVDDIGYFDEPYFQDGFIAQAADSVVARGIPYFSAAGNSARMAWDAVDGFHGTGYHLVHEGNDLGEAHRFGVDELGNDIYIMSIGTYDYLEFVMFMQWSEPHFSVSGSPGSGSDLDFFIYRQDNGKWTDVVEMGVDSNLGHDPFEILSAFFFDDVPTTYGLAITLKEGTAPEYIKIIILGSDLDLQFPTYSSTSFGHQNAAMTAGVAAAPYNLTPEFGVTPPLPEPFTSLGGTPIFFDTDGNRYPYGPKIRPQPRFTGPDNTVTTFFGDPDEYGFFRFSGTSAAAPHIAAVAALMKAVDAFINPLEIYSILEKTAIDMDDPFTKGFDVGFDHLTGYGFVDALAAMKVVGGFGLPGTSKSSRSSKSSTGWSKSGGSKSGKRTKFDKHEYGLLEGETSYDYSYDVSPSGRGMTRRRQRTLGERNIRRGM